MRDQGPRPGAADSAGAADVVAARLRAVQQALAALDADPEVRKRLNARFMTICTSLKLPDARVDRGLRRLDQLMADAQSARHDIGKEA